MSDDRGKCTKPLIGGRPDEELGDDGLEPGDVTPRNANDLQNPPDRGGAESGAVDAESGADRPDLDALARALAGLSDDDRKRLMDQLGTATEGGEQ